MFLQLPNHMLQISKMCGVFIDKNLCCLDKNFGRAFVSESEDFKGMSIQFMQVKTDRLKARPVLFCFEGRELLQRQSQCMLIF